MGRIVVLAMIGHLFLLPCYAADIEKEQECLKRRGD